MGDVRIYLCVRDGLLRLALGFSPRPALGLPLPFLAQGLLSSALQH